MLKKERLLAALREVQEQPDKVVLLFTDEAGFYRRPTPDWLWARKGREQPRLQLGHGSNNVLRVLGVLDASSGRVQAWDAAKITAERLGRWWLSAGEAYPQAEKIYLVMDNWPVHFNQRVMTELAKDPRIEVLPLPTYSPWLNNIEKLWRWLKQKVTHAHPWTNDFNTLRNQVRAELVRASALPELRRYCGLEKLLSQ